LRICLAHFGSEFYWNQFIEHPEDKGSWFYLIKDMLEENKNLYTDISYTLNNEQFFPLLKILLSDLMLKDQILFGSDYYMVENKANERRFGLDLRGYLGEESFRLISFDNPRKFLNV
jgi:predicted TIM-barrel fold metal-dependent hydrolase